MLAAAADQWPRVEDYLNDKLQSQADLENLDALIESVKGQQELLRQQLHDARLAQQESQQTAVAGRKEIKARAEAFTKKQYDVDRRMQALTQSEVSDEAVSRFDTTMRKLQCITLAEHYVEILGQIERLVKETEVSFASDPRTGMPPYARLQKIASDLHLARSSTDEAAPHLIHHVNVRIKALWQLMRDKLSGDLNKSLSKMGWPNKGIKMEPAVEQEWAQGVKLLLDLQMTRLVSHDESSEPEVLLPLEVMIKPLELRFRYHFEGERPTNRLDKPEYFLAHIVELMNDYDGFFVYYLQPLLQVQFKGTSLALNAAYIDTTTALITAILPMLRKKLKAIMPEVASNPQVLSHTMQELMKFDTSLRDDWQYRSGNGDWKGMAGEILEGGYFARWLELEKEFALSRYQNIVEAPDAGEIDYDSVDPNSTKPTKASMRVNDLVEAITERYRPLVMFAHKLRFAVDIQLAIFDRYYERLTDALEAFIAISSPVARRVQGFTREEVADAHGLKGLDRLCRVYGSAEYLVRKMSDWNNDVFFLELWDELQYRAQGPKATSNVEALAQVAVQKNVGDGALFDETCGHYESLRARAEDLIQEHIFNFVKESLHPYNRVNTWSTLDQDDTTTAELTAPLQSLGQSLEFVKRCHAKVSLRRIGRSVLHQMQTWMWDHTVQRNNFSEQGSQQLRRDVRAICDTADLFCGEGFGISAMRKLWTATDLLCLPIEGPDDTAIDLRDVEGRIFASNEEARLTLDELGYEAINESDARLLLRKRIEIAT